MMGTLYDCLREARLEKYYPAFRANGITRSESLANLTMPEFCAMGITGTEDRRRLVELVKIIKSVHRGNIGSGGGANAAGQQRKRQQSPTPHRHTQRISSPGSQPVTQSDKKVPRRHTHSPPEGATGGIRLEVTRDVSVSVRERVPNFSAASYMDMLEFTSDSSHSDAGEYLSHSHSSDGEPAQPSRAASAPAPVFSYKAPRKTAPAERVRHSKPKGYNYGVPGNRDSVKAKVRSSGRLSKDERIRVCVRKRPLSRREIRGNEQDIVTAESTTMVVVKEPKVAVDLTAYTLKHEFMFDEVFDENCSNEDVYIRAARPLISTVFQGSNATFFAYGQTGAGKTHTMMGGNGVTGLYQLAAQDVFNIISSGQHGADLHVWVSFFEIYCGQLFDLLNRRNRLVAREDASHQVCIAGLTETEVPNVETLIMVLDYGNSVRSRGISGVNPDSSRSHALLQLEIRRSDDTKLGKISFIDLAGSERASDMPDSDRQTRIEGAEINQSLLALKECIRSIDQESRHTPFRQSKLTHILKDAFVGNSRTCMIANLAPNQIACEHTLNTLRYADRVKELRRDGGQANGTSASVGNAMNLLMNIPLTAPSIFHPSNVLSTSTPVRPHPSRTGHAHSSAADFTFDPSETPIRGHHVQSKPVPKALFRVQQVGGSPGSASRGTKPRWQGALRPRTGSPLEAAASQGAAQPHPEASPSESDQTDTDSCNVTHPTETRAAPTQPNIPVIASTDTEFDFPTSDFNNIDEQLNDLNLGGNKGRDGRPETEGQTTGVGGEGKGQSGGEHTHAAAKTTPRSTAATGTGARVQGKNWQPAVSRQSSAPSQPPLTRQSSVSPTPSIKLSKSSVRNSAGGVVVGVDVLAAGDSPASHVHGEQQDTGEVKGQPLTGSFDDELLFATPSETDQQQAGAGSVVSAGGVVSAWSGRMLGKSSGGRSAVNTVLNKPNKHLANVQQMMLPAVLTAHSSDLTSIAQRSPLRLGAEKTMEMEGARGISQIHRDPAREGGGIQGEVNPAATMNQLSAPDHMAPRDRGDTGVTDALSQRAATGRLNSPRVVPDTNPQGAAASPRVTDSSPRSLGSLSDRQRTNAGNQYVNSHTSGPSSDPLMPSLSTPGGDLPSHRPLISSVSYTKVAATVLPEADSSDTKLSAMSKMTTTSATSKMTTSAALVTEKLWSGAVFSPIHPQPVSTTGTSVVTAGATRGSILQPTPVTGVPLTSTTSSATVATTTHFTTADRDQARVSLVSAHEDQLASITSLCKQEMKLLLSAKKAAPRSFDDYIHRVNNVLAQKMSAIQLLQQQILDYRNRYIGGPQQQPHQLPAAAAAAGASVWDSDANT